jgi:ribonuclease BN (tRNA processing enzyme)
MRMQVIGCGDAFGSGGRANTCFLFEASHGPFLVDCGASALIKLKEYRIDPDEIGTILISHLHGDHFGGLVFLLREASLYKRRTRALTIAGPPGLGERLKAALEVFFPGGSAPPETFALNVLELEANKPTFVDFLTVTPFPVSHPCGAVPYALRVEVEGKIVAYSADTIWVDGLLEAGRNADLFLCEAYTYATPMGSHLTYETVVRRMPEIAPRQVLLTHLGPDMLLHASEAAFPIAKDGLVVDF